MVESMSCVVCEEPFDPEVHQPVALPTCGHTFCRMCLVNLQERNPTLVCPTCRQPHAGEDASCLPTNFLVLNLLPDISERDDAILQSKLPDSHADKMKEKKDDVFKKDDKCLASLDDNHLDCNEKVNESRSRPDEACSSREDNQENSLKEDYNDRQKKQEGRQDNVSEDCHSQICHSSRSGREPNQYIWYKDWRIWVLFVVFIIIMASVAIGVALGCAPNILNQMGFTSTGVARKSYASTLMSSAARSNNGTIPADSWVSWLQNAGHKGFSSKAKALIALVSGLVGAGVAAVLFGAMVSICLLVHHCRTRKYKDHLLVDDLPLMSVEH